MIDKVKQTLSKHGYFVTKIEKINGVITGTVQYSDGYGIGFGNFNVSDGRITVVTAEGHNVKLLLV